MLNGNGLREILLISVYQCCQSTNPNARDTASCQQQILLSEENRPNLDPRNYFRKDLSCFIHSFRDKNQSISPIIIVYWNESFGGLSAAKQLCTDFNLVNIFDRLYPNHPEFKTFQRASKTIDYALASPDIADRVLNFSTNLSSINLLAIIESFSSV